MSTTSTAPYVRYESRDDYVLQTHDWQVMRSAVLAMTDHLRTQEQILTRQMEFMEKQERARISSEKDNKLNVVSVIAVFIATMDVGLLSYVRDTFGDGALTTSAHVVIGCLYMSIILALVPAFLTGILNHGGVSEWTRSVLTFYHGVFTFNTEKMHSAICGKIVKVELPITSDKECGGIHPNPKKKHGYIKLFLVGHVLLCLSLVVKLGWFMLFLLPSVTVLAVGVVTFVWDQQSAGVGFASSATCIYALAAMLAFGLNGFLRRKFKTIITD